MSIVSKLLRTIAGNVIGCSLTVGTALAGPPLDRPSPPPLCADGICRPNPTTFGWYQTRWRRWPTVALEPTAAEPAVRTPELPSHELPPKEEEDRAAPKPTEASRSEGDTDGERPTEGRETPRPTTLAPPGSGLDLPLPSDERAPSTMPFDQLESPTTRPQTVPLNDGLPTGDIDPPPAPPFGSPSFANGPVVRKDLRPAARPVRRLTPATSRAREHDPPPALPITLAAHLD
jgi:hypothetical protein